MSAQPTPILSRRSPHVKTKEPTKEPNIFNIAPSRYLQHDRNRNERTRRAFASSPMPRPVPLTKTKSEERIIAERERKVHCSKVRNGTRNWSAKSNRASIEEMRKEISDKLRQRLELKQKLAAAMREKEILETKVKATKMRQISRLNASMTDIWE